MNNTMLITTATQNQLSQQKQELESPSQCEQYVRFKAGFEGVGLDLLLPNQKKLLQMHDYVIKINKQNWQKHQMNTAFSMIQSIMGLKKILLDSNFQKQIIKQIYTIDFETLININLSNNNIETIELIGWINAPKLKILNLSKNRITSIKPIRKLNTPLLTSLDLSDNLVIQGEPLVEVYEQVLENFTLECAEERNPMLNQINWYYKLQSVKPRLCLSNYRNLKNKRILSLLRERISK